MVDEEIDRRLAGLEARIPGAIAPRLPVRWWIPRLIGGSLTVTIVAALVAGTVLAGTVVGAVTVINSDLCSQFGSGWACDGVTGYPGAENEGQPLHGARLECMTPTAADAYLRARGITDVVWQVEGPTTANGRDSSTQRSVPPVHGWVVPGGFVDGVLYMVIDQRTSMPAGDCPGEVMP